MFHWAQKIERRYETETKHKQGSRTPSTFVHCCARRRIEPGHRVDGGWIRGGGADFKAIKSIPTCTCAGPGLFAKIRWKSGEKICKMKTVQMPSAVPQSVTSPILPRPAVGLAGHIQNSLMKNSSTQTGPAGKGKKQIRLLIVDDHPVVRKGITACLTQNAKLQVIGEAANGTDALTKARELRPDIILMDIDLPEKNGLVVTETIRKELPQIKVLILSMHTNTDYVLRIVQSGASGYVLKGGSTEDLVRAIETVNSGDSYFSPEVARTALNQFVRGSSNGGGLAVLTAREREVLIHIADGLSNKEIASQLGVGVRTVETHRERIMKKLGIHSVAGLTKFAISQGLVSLQ
jgi:two-component system nitrate/nitrite response regulator NarL